MNTTETLTGTNGTLRRLLAPHDHMGSLMPAWVRETIEGVELLLVDVSSTTEVWVPHDGAMVHAGLLSGWPRCPAGERGEVTEATADAQVLYVRTPQIDSGGTGIGIIVGPQRIEAALADLGELRNCTADAEMQRRATVERLRRGLGGAREKLSTAEMAGFAGAMLGSMAAHTRPAPRVDVDDDDNGTPCVALQHPLDFGGIRAFYGFAFSECTCDAEVKNMADNLARELGNAAADHTHRLMSSTTDGDVVLPRKDAPPGEALEPDETSGSRAPTPA